MRLPLPWRLTLPNAQCRIPNPAVLAFPRQSLLCIATAAALLAAACLPALGQGARSGSLRITLRANPETVPADGKSVSRIHIEVRDGTNRPAPDGTPVFVRVDTGLLSLPDADRQQSIAGTTTGGYLTVHCSSETPGAATITASAQDSRNEVIVYFVAEGEAVQARARVVNLRGGWVAYCPELELIQARDGARAVIGPLTFEAADGLELRMSDHTMRGWGARIVRKDEELQGADFFYDLIRQRGVLRRFSDLGIERVAFSVYSLREAALTWEPPPDAFRRDEREGDTWLVARSCRYFIGQKVALERAKLYAGPQKVLSFPPHWVIGLPGYTGASNTQVLGASSDGGLAVDLPVFYRVTDDWAGSLRLQRGVAGSSFVARDGWSLGIAEEYNTGEAKGVIEAGGLLKDDWGLVWRDERDVFGDSQGFFTVAWPDHRNLFADAAIYRYGSAHRFNFRAQYDRPEWAGDSYHFAADWLTNPRLLTPRASHRLGASLGLRRLSFEQDRWTFANELYGALDMDPWRIHDNATLTPSFTNVYSWDTGGFNLNSARARLRADAKLGRRGNLGVSYSLGHRSGDTSRPGINQSLGLNLSLLGTRDWNAYGSGTWDMVNGDNYAYVAASRRLTPRWRVGLIATHYDFSETRYNDLELEVSRAIANRELGLRYSVDRRRVWLEFGGLGLPW